MQHIGEQQQVPRRRHRQKFGEAFDDAEENSGENIGDVHIMLSSW
jgi:hypothetical protein